MSDIERKARRAYELLHDDVAKAVFAHVKADISAEWESTRSTAHVKREKLWMELAALERLKRKFQSIVDSGKIAAQ